MVKPVYYSEAMKKYYFNEKVFGNFKTITVYGVENINIEPEDVRLDKNKRPYVVMELKREFSKENYKSYFKALRVARKKVEDVENKDSTEESAF